MKFRNAFFTILLLVIVTGISTNISAAQPLEIEDIRSGKGITAQPYAELEVHYRGWLKDGTLFDSSHERDKPFKFTLSVGQVIHGWDIGIVGMTEGGIRILSIPAKLAYGSRGAGKLVPPNADLKFEVQLIKANSPPFISLNTEELAKKMESRIKVIDIRREDEWTTTGVIPNAIQFTAFDKRGQFIASFPQQLKEYVSPDEEFALICRSGNRTARLVNWLANKGGYPNAYNVLHGMNRWITESRSIQSIN